MRALRLIAVLLTFVPVSTFALVPLPSEKDKWVAMDAGEFHIYSSTSERETKEIATSLLRMREAIGKITKLNVHSPLPTYVFVFKNERAFAPYRDALFRKQDATVSGGFLASRVANFIVMDADAEGGITRVIYHELVHYFLRNTTPSLPLWVDEGLAEYYSTFAVNGDRISIGKPIPEHVYWLRGSTLMPLAQQFAIDFSSPEYSEQSRQGAFYAQSWALIHYLFTSDETRRMQLAKFLAFLREGQANDVAFRAAFGTDYASLEKELRLYVRRPAFAFTNYRFDELAIAEPSPIREVNRDELLYALGALYAYNRGTQGEGEALLREAIRINPKHAEAHGVLAYLQEMKHDRAAATQLYEKAINLGTNDASIYVIYASTILERDPQRSDMLRARQLLQRATQLDANSSRAWAGICMSYVGENGDLTPGISACEKSLALAASQEDTALNLMQLYVEAGRTDDARKLNDNLIARSANAEYVRQGRETLNYAEVRRAQQLFESGKREEAIAIIRPIAETTTTPSLKQNLQPILEQYDSLAARNRISNSIRQALEKADAGKMKEAIQILDELIPTVTDTVMQAHLRKMRKDYAAKVK